MNLNEGVTQPQNAPQESQPKGQTMDQKTQQEFDIFIANGMQILHSEQVTNSFLNKILKNENKLEAIATVVVDLTSKLAESASGNGVGLSNSTLVHGANFLLGEVVSVAEAAGMQALTDEQKTEAYQRAVGMYLDGAVKSGKVSKEQLLTMGEQAKKTHNGQKIQNMGAL